ncbi:MAG: hypothetical protein IJJ33_00130, partial [Victivallales bacterium]|nr:hypothetical protein [Victivallales bacterium]
MMDYDWRRTVHPRQQSVLLWRDGALANAFWLGKTDSGVYAPLALTGAPGQLTLRIMKHRGACVSVSGLFLDTLADSLPYLPLRFYPEGTCRIIPLQDVYQKDRLDGEVDKDTLHWYERMRTSQGIGRIALAREYAQRKNRLLSPSAGMVGRFIYAIAAENCGEATVALPDWTNALPTTLDGLHLLPVLLNCLSDGVGSVRHGCWYLFATKWALRHLPPADVLSVKEAGDFLCALGMSCRGGPEAIPAMQACLEEARRRGAPDSQMWNLDLYLQRSRGTTGISVVPATHVPS